jgi:hypothetical protein
MDTELAKLVAREICAHAPTATVTFTDRALLIDIPWNAAASIRDLIVNGSTGEREEDRYYLRTRISGVNVFVTTDNHAEKDIHLAVANAALHLHATEPRGHGKLRTLVHEAAKGTLGQAVTPATPAAELLATLLADRCPEDPSGARRYQETLRHDANTLTDNPHLIETAIAEQALADTDTIRLATRQAGDNPRQTHTHTR